jgi:simple sugar transport system ATP-binding protein
MENGAKVADAATNAMTAEELEEVIRQGGRVVEKREAV